MNFKFLQEYHLKKGIEKHLKSRDGTRVDANFKTVGVLLNLEQYPNKERFVALAEHLEILSKDLKIIYYNEENSKIPVFEQNIFSPKNFSWKGDFMNPAIEEFLQRDYDIFVGYFNTKNLYVNYIASRVKAGLRIGFSKADNRIFDFLFKMDIRDYELFEKEFIKYINIFKKTNIAI